MTGELLPDRAVIWAVPQRRLRLRLQPEGASLEGG